MSEMADAVPVIRPASSDDLETLEQFIEPFVAHRRILPRTRDELEELLPRGFVAENEGRIIGFAALEVYSRKLAELRSLAVDETFRGRGVGRRLVEACLQRAKELCVFEVIVITSEDVFFQSCGFDFTLPCEKKALFYQTRDKP